jgi:diaminopimelate epimerase
MARLYDARGNLYAVISPEALRALGVALPLSAAEAAAQRHNWTAQAIAAVCNWPPGTQPPGSKPHRSDGLLVGPFEAAAPSEMPAPCGMPAPGEMPAPCGMPAPGEMSAPSASFDVLIVNTDGTFAERSGNGLTIFAQSLTDAGRVTGTEPFILNVHHDNAGSVSPVPTQVTPALLDGTSGFWLDIGAPGFGAHAVGAGGDGVGTPTFNTREVNRVERLAALNPAWHSSVFVRVGNPHCVTLVTQTSDLPAFEDLHEAELNAALTRIAFVAGESGDGDPCPGGINLQWAAQSGANRITARVFERGEGPTASSGTSASAVASAAWFCGWVQAGLVEVVMPGGTAPLRLIERDGQLQQVQLFGAAQLKPEP